MPQLITAEGAAALVKSGMWLDYGFGATQAEAFDRALAARVQNRIPPAELARDVLGPYLRNVTHQGITRAESATQGLALALMSPEFQRR